MTSERVLLALRRKKWIVAGANIYTGDLGKKFVVGISTDTGECCALLKSAAFADLRRNASR